MATTQRTPDSISYNGDQALIDSLRQKINTNQVVNADDINNLIDLANAWDNHTHTYTDVYQTATFGNTGDRSTYQQSTTTDRHDEDSSGIGGINNSTVITAAKHNEIKNVVNKLRSHFHNIFDRTAI